MVNKETAAIRIQSERSQFKEHSTPIYPTSSFVFDDAEEMRASFADEIDRNIYSRFSNPNTNEFVDKMCALEGAEAGFASASGMSTVFSTFATFLSAGDHIVACSSIFGASHSVISNILPKWDISFDFADIQKLDEWEDLIKENTKIFYVETPTNPGLDIVDLEWLGNLLRERNVLFVVDNCFATPVLQNPIKFGADLVIHSATKYLDGQGRVLGGVVLGKEELIKDVYAFSRATGPSLSPFNSWILSKSLETLHVRIERHCKNALNLAQELEGHPNVESVKYPFLQSHPEFEVAKRLMSAGGGLLAFNLNGGIEAGVKFLNSLKMCSLTANLGDTRTIVSHPASTTHAKLTEQERLSTGIAPGLVRISVGLEHLDDIISDVVGALNQI